MAKFIKHILEPLAAAPGFKPDDYLALKLRVKLANVLVSRLVRFVLKTTSVNLTVFSCQITQSLLRCMEINADVNWHRVPPSGLKDPLSENL